MKYLIRPEEPRDHRHIYDLTKRAFAPMPFADGNEQDLINALREAGALNLSLVAEKDGQVVGHVALSEASHESGEVGWYVLGPIAVVPELQRKGIGGALIAGAKHWMESNGARGCIVVGDTNYYPRHGFLPSPAQAPEGTPPEHVMVLTLRGSIPDGRFSFHPLFYP